MYSMYSMSLDSLLCHTCLSAGRVLRAMHDYADVFWRVVGPIDLDVSQLLICWECEALLRSVVRFQNKVHTANSVLGLFGPTNQASSLSNLVTIELTSISCDIEIKTEPNEPNIQETTDTFTDDYNDFVNTTDEPPSDNTIKKGIECVEIKKEKLASRKLKRKKESDEDYTEEQPNMRRDMTRQKKSPATHTYNVKVCSSAKGANRFSKVTLNETELLEMLMKERESEFFKDKKYKCKDCVIGFQNKQSYAQHMTRHKKSAGNYKCEVCKTRFLTQPLLAEHIKSHYEKMLCYACGFECYAMARMMFHYKDNHITYSYVCTKCEMKFQDRTECNRHYRSAHIDCRFQCDYCGKGLKSKYGLMVHMKRRHLDIKCGECGALSGSLRELKIHQRAVHAAGGAAAAYCVECDKQFVNEYTYQDHLKKTVKHAGPKIKRYPCDGCDMRFDALSCLRAHRDSVHLKIKRHRCDDCGMKFAARHNLQAHHRTRHEPRRPETCHVCGKLYANKKVLTRHMLIHTGERPFACPHCASKFNQTSAMRTHVRRVHRTEPPSAARRGAQPSLGAD